MKYSIVIPTYIKYQEAFRECLQTVIKYTDFSETELIVVANGSPEATRHLVWLFQVNYPINLIWFDEGIGYTKAINEGIKSAKGEYVILLNDDIVLMEQSKNDWINILHHPFLQDDKVGITGIMKEFCPSANREFLLFFCVMIKRAVIDLIGLPDEIFNPGYGEDCDYSFRIEDAGYKVVQVPDDKREYYEFNKRTGQFPLYHKGNISFKEWEGGNELIARNNEILRQRYNNRPKVNIENAKKCDGFMSEQELQWLGEIASQCKGVFVEVGSWHGRSSRAIADNLPEGSILVCVDTWNGSVTEQHTNHASAKNMNGDAAYYEFLQNNIDLISSGKILPLRMNSVNAAAFFKEKGILANVVFVDAGHEKHEVKKDIQSWISLIVNDGIMCGHDYTHVDVWGGVKEAVDELLKVSNPSNTSIWATRIIHELPKPKVFDCFSFNNELNILEIRFDELYDVVDRFVIVEAMMTHSGKPKELVFHNNLKRFEKYLNKVTYLVVEEFPEGDSWTRERYQRDYIMKGLENCAPDDIIIISDCDEIPSREKVKYCKENWLSFPFINSLEMDLYYYNTHCKAADKWTEAKIIRYGNLKDITPCEARHSKAPVIKDAGSHYSYFGSVEAIIKKIEDSAHVEYDRPKFKDPKIIQERIEKGEDVLGREYVKFEMV